MIYANRRYAGSLIGTALLTGGLLTMLFFHFTQPRSVDTEAMRDVSVSIRTISHVSTDSYGDTVWAPSTGSGFLVSNETCEVWTNHHVIDGAAVVEVFPRGWQQSHGIPARVINSTPQMDVAILEMDHCEGMPAAKLGDSRQVVTGDETFVVGNPFGRNPDSVSRGIISHTERYLAAPAAYFQTDAAINPGNSGGALFDRNGVAIGLTTAIANNKSGSNVGIGYALPVNDVIQVVAKLRAGPPSWGDAGLDGALAALTAEEAAIFNVPGGGAAVSVMRSPAEGPSANLLVARDVIYRIDQQTFTNPAHAHRIIGRKSPGDKIDFSLIRNGDLKTVTVTLADGWDKRKQTTQTAETYQGVLGMELEMWEDDNSFRGQYSSPVITRIHSLGPAHRGYITSSQSSIARRGPVITPIQLNVRTVTGTVLKGRYQAVSDISSLNAIAEEAHQLESPLLLEIESWGRNPADINEPLHHSTTAFYRIMPTLSPDQIDVDEQADDLPDTWHTGHEQNASHRL